MAAKAKNKLASMFFAQMGDRIFSFQEWLIKLEIMVLVK